MSRKSGFTLVELLVVIAIIGILVALLLPAIQAAREAARRTSCTNKLKQIGIALLNYHDTRKTFPPGGITNGPCCSTKSFTNWAIEILPQLEEQALYAKYDQKKFNEDRIINYPVISTLLEAYLCPSEENRELSRPDTGPGAGLFLAPGSYRAMAGVNMFSGGSEMFGWVRDHSTTNSPFRGNRGVLHTIGTNNLTEESISDITDGTSHTIAVGEFTTRTDLERRTYWGYTYFAYNKGEAMPQSRTLSNDHAKCVAIGGPGGVNACDRMFGSMHPEIIQFVYCDGSVRSMPTSINMDVWLAMGSIAGDEVFTAP